MNNKGIYTGIVGILAIMLILSGVLISKAQMNEGKTELYSRSAEQFNVKMLNEYHLFDRAVVEAAVDSVRADCSWNITETEQKVADYITYVDGTIPGDVFIDECGASFVDPQVSASASEVDISVNFQTSCNFYNGESGLFARAADTLEYHVRAVAVGSPTGCDVTVYDILAGNAQVYQVP